MLHPSIYYHEGSVVPWRQIPLRKKVGSLLAFAASGLCSQAIRPLEFAARCQKSGTGVYLDRLWDAIDSLHGACYYWHRRANGTGALSHSQWKEAPEEMYRLILFPDPEKPLSCPCQRPVAFLGIGWWLWLIVAVALSVQTWRCQEWPDTIALAILAVVAWVGTVMALTEAAWGPEVD